MRPDAQYVRRTERECRRLRPDIAARDELWRSGADFAEEGEEEEKSQYFNIGPSDKLNFKFVRTGFFNFSFYIFTCLSPELPVGLAFYIGFLLDWRVLPLCPWGLIFFTWFILFDASEEDRRHLTDET